jgi:lactate dehydrogenase-like 2-hydroxyacid dehydrogenase
MKLVILDADTLGEDVDLSGFEQLGHVTIYPNTSPKEVAGRIKDCDVVICNKTKLTKEKLSDVKQLRLICETATGYDNIDVAYCREQGIAVCNVAGYSVQSVAQVTIAMALSLAIHLSDYQEHVTSGRYTKNGVHNHLKPVFHELSGMTWGIAGLGNIGRQVASVAQALGCKVIAYKRTPDVDYHCVDLDALCRESDILSIHLPLSDETYHLFDKEKLALLKKTAILIHVGRGAVVDEEALALAVEHDEIGGIGVDVYSKEPMDEIHPYQRILSRKNVCLTPHMAWGAREARQRCIDEIVENIKAFEKGEKRNRVD